MATMTTGIPAWVEARRAEAMPRQPLLPPPPPPGDTLTLCHKKIYFGTAEEPPEYCPEEARPGSEYCREHGDDTDPDEDNWHKHEA